MFKGAFLLHQTEYWTMAQHYRFKCMLLFVVNVLLAESTCHSLCAYSIYHNAAICVSYEDHMIIFA